MAGFDPDVFGGGAGFDNDVFGTPMRPKLTRAQIQAQIDNDAISQGARAFPGQGSDALGGVSQAVLNGLGGFVRGAGSIGATIAYPFDKALDLYYGDRGKNLSSLITGKERPSRNEERRAQIEQNIQEFGVQPDSFMYGAGKLGAEIAGTLPVGGLAGKAAGAVLPSLGVSAPAANAIATGLETGGFRVPGMTGLPGLATRVGTGAATGYLSAGLVDPEQAGTGAVIGGLLPPVAQGAGKVGQFASDKLKGTARWLMGTSVKPTLKQWEKGIGDSAIETMLQNGISPTPGGVAKLEKLIGAADDRITQGIGASDAQIFMPHAADRVNDTRTLFTQQISPTADLEAIDAVKNNFLNHPQYPGPTISVQDAQKLKQGTYRVLAGKYGEQGSASTEAQKAIARGLKEEIANAVPGVADANAELSNYLNALEVAQRRAYMARNNNPAGLAALAPTKANLLAFLGDRSTALKALAARGMYSASGLPQRSLGLLDNPVLVPYARQGLLATEASP